MPTTTEQANTAKAYVDEHLHALCEEVADWDDCKGLKPDGKLNPLFELCAFAGDSKFRVAKAFVANAAIRYVVKSRWDY